MYKKLNQLGFVIGLFFVIVSLVLFGNILLNQLSDKLSVFTAIAFLLFGVFMLFFGNKKEEESSE